jgi:hypothetical protein
MLEIVAGLIAIFSVIILVAHAIDLPGPVIGHVFMLPHLCALDLPQ